jgi:signal transduction histidine kinase
MNVATRITVATAVVVALASAAYAYFDLRARGVEKQQALEREARAVAGTLRATLESQASTFHSPGEEQLRMIVAVIGAAYEYFDLRANGTEKRQALEHETHALTSTLRGTLEALRSPTEQQLRDLSRPTGGWRVNVIPRARATLPPGPDATAAQLRRLNTLLDVPQLCSGTPNVCSDVEGDTYFFMLPLRGAGQSASDEPVVLGMLDIERSSDVLAMTSNDYMRAGALVVLIVAVSTIVVGALARRLVSRPITKLLRGIDDVAKGDLSHVILSERDDEIGKIATRFNDMTFSLRESRGETQRQNEAKLALEQRLGQTEKLATIGQLAAEIAHEVGTPLNVIAGRARSMQRKSKDPEAVEKNAEIVAEQTARITRIIQRLLDFTRRKVGATGKAEINVNELALTTMELLSGQFAAAKVRTRLDRAEGLPRVAGDPDRLQQVMINLLLNAAQAMPDGGALEVETMRVRRARPGLEGGEEQPFVMFSVRDSGVGIPAEIRDKIFDPFYTTKEGRGGTGLGLAVVSGIVKEHDGWIDVDDVDSGGTVFRVYLPA